MKELENETLENITAENDLTIVDFYADWCGPCKTMDPILQELSETYKIIKVNVDNHGELANKYGIRGIPTLLFFKKDQVMKTTTGIQSKSDIVKFANEILNNDK